MREILFRAWDGKEMKPAFDLTQNPKYWWKGNRDYPLMQYTGLDDKNNKRVFEGDVVKIHADDPEEYHEVKFACGGFMAGDIFLDDYWNLNGHMFEVVGNRFENPELAVKVNE